MECKVVGCESGSVTSGWCRKHYVRFWRTGSTDDTALSLARGVHVCTVDGCASTARSGGLCDKHYQRMRLRGTTDNGPRAKLPILERFWNKVDKRGPDECWLWNGAKPTAKTYGQIQAGAKGSKNVLVHRLSYEIANGAIPEGKIIMHTCDTPLCVNPAHLLAGSYAENTLDAIQKGRLRRGEDHGNAKVTESAVRAIRQGAGSIHEKAVEFGLSTYGIKAILARKTWRHVT